MMLAMTLFAVGAVAGPLTPTRGALPWADWNFISTTDIHGYIAGHGSKYDGQYSATFADFVSFVDGMRGVAASKNVELFVVDSGDQHDGTALGDNLKAQAVGGALTMPVIEYADYDVLSIGNHELYVNDIIDDVHANVSPAWGSKFLTGNVYYNSNGTTSTFANKFRKFTGTKGTRVTALGFLFDFTQFGTHALVTKVEMEVQQTWFTDAIADAPDFFLLVGHLHLRGTNYTETSAEWQAAISAIRRVHATVPILIFGGHEHLRDFKVMGKNVYGLEAGRYMETVGFVSFNTTTGQVARRYLDSNVPTFNYHLGQPENAPLGSATVKGQTVKSLISNVEIATNSSRLLGVAPQTYYYHRTPPNDPQSIYYLLGQTMAPTLQKANSNPAYFMIYSGSIRSDIFAGNFTFDDAFQASPFPLGFLVIPNIPFGVIKKFSTVAATLLANLVRRRGPAISCNNATVGYVTQDDFGIDGEDTFHCPVPFSPLDDGTPIFSPLTFPADAKDADMWDLVYYNFIEADVLAILKAGFGIDKKGGLGVNSEYIRGWRATDLFPMIAAKYWSVGAASNTTGVSTATATGTVSATVSAGASTTIVSVAFVSVVTATPASAASASLCTTTTSSVAVSYSYGASAAPALVSTGAVNLYKSDSSVSIVSVIAAVLSLFLF
ncbi:Metallo-dependent phosphatase-like protein [Chytriomyces sp. MP71]|nr:Metallo-dependent phosphatase-like protein [Chytriomyces sp. MP71]